MSDHTSFAGKVQFDQTLLSGQLSVETPEQVDLRFPVAGIGSRFLATLTDTIIIVLTYLLLILIAYITHAGRATVRSMDHQSSTAQNWWIAAFTILNFLIVWGYFALFETFWNGQTPGKRLLKIRVIKDSGRSITLFEALARNLIRVVDYMPGLYLVGVIAMLCNRSQKRLGDLAAGTIVVHERTQDQPLLTHHSRGLTANIFSTAGASSPFTPAPQSNFFAPAGSTHLGDDILPADAISRLKPADLHLIETFFNRALDLSIERRAELAQRVAATIAAHMGIALPPDINPERLLETVAHRMRTHSRF
jgi:uncharacterized RDD family membrane protein YckC